jgi:YYY domain-containing protein
MMEVGLVLRWWLVVTLLGWGAFLLLRPLLRSLADQGFINARFAGYLLSAFGMWLLASLHVAPFTWGTCLVVAVVMVAGGAIVGYRDRQAVRAFLRQQWKTVVVAEVLFLVTFLSFALLRSYMPEIEGTEKVPDMAFLTGAVQSRHMPPQDPWCSGHHINYFYFGHYAVAHLSKLTGVHLRFGFNLGLALIFAFICQGAYGLAFNLLKSRWLALLGPFFVGVMSNLEGFVQKVIKGSTGFNWWSSSRVMIRHAWEHGERVKVDETINEFPFWSFILGDMHAHVLAAPLLLFNLTLLLVLLDQGLWRRAAERRWPLAGLILVAGVFLGATPATNYWEVPTVLLLMGGVLIIRLSKGPHEWQPALGSWRPALPTPGLFVREIGLIAGVAAAAVVLYLPFHLNYVKQSSTLGWLPARMQASTEHFLTIFGFFVFMTLTWILHLLLSDNDRRGRTEAVALGAGGLAVAAYLLNSLPVALCLGFVAGLSAVMLLVRLNRAALWACFLGGLAWCMVLGCEFVYIEDFYHGALIRMNTIFKFYYQAWLLLGVSCAYFVGAFLQALRYEGRRWTLAAWFPVFGAFAVASLCFNAYAPGVRTGQFRLSPPTLDGMSFLERRYLDDYAAMMWIEENVAPDGVVLEATGEAFSLYGRISAFTGRPTVLGWANHEALWRDQTWKITGDRTRDIEKAYNSRSWDDLRAVVETYAIDYVYVGNLERKRYEQAGLDKFSRLGTLSHDEDGGQIYRVP